MTGVLKEKFGESPFSILDAMSGDWQTEKDDWKRLGILPPLGKNRLGFSKTIAPDQDRTSEFDPVLCDLIYRWFAASRGQVIDPFAGGSVRGIVAGCSDLDYWGCELRQDRVESNREQVEKIREKHRGMLMKIPEWVVGDSSVMLDDAPEADFIFSCPPYG